MVLTVTSELTVGSMFTGIGGIDLGLERSGMRVIWQAETDPYCTRVLAKHWPNIPNLGDVNTVDWHNIERPDLICGGYPCQPFSIAGKRRGEQDDRHLWPRMHDAIRILRPRWVLLENVAAHLSLGFERVLADLASIGFDAEWDCIPASAVGAPHRRDRIFVVAYPNRGRREGLTERHSEPVQDTADRHSRWGNTDGLRDDVADTASIGLSLRDAVTIQGRAEPEQPTSQQPQRCGVQVSERFTTGQERWPTPTRNDWWKVEPDVCRVVDGFPGRVDRVRTLGNAVVPAVAQHVGQMIVAADQAYRELTDLPRPVDGHTGTVAAT